MFGAFLPASLTPRFFAHPSTVRFVSGRRILASAHGFGVQLASGPPGGLEAMMKMCSPGRVPADQGRTFPSFGLWAAAVAMLVLFIGAGVAAADPVRVVTAGSVFQLVEDGETGFGLFGAGFELRGEVSSIPAQACGPCIPGSAVNLGATMRPLLFPPGSAVIDGQTFESVFLDGLFNFTAGSVIVPSVPVGQIGVPASAPFTFNGVLSGFADVSLSGAPLFSIQLTGRGIASTAFFNFPSNNGNITRDGFNFEFQDAAAPVPEPGSLLLFGSGAAWMASRWRLRRRLEPSRNPQRH